MSGDDPMLACRCGQVLSLKDMERLAPPRATVADSLTVQRIACRQCVEELERMAARTWRAGDPEPVDVDALVDVDGVTWVRGCVCGSDAPDEPSPNWHEHLIRHLSGGAVTGGSIGNDWFDLWGCVPEGSVLREATTDEAQCWVERWTT